MDLKRRAKFYAWSVLSNRPFIFPLIQKFAGNSFKKYCDKKTDICIEGFPSSANSFVYNIFRKIRTDIKIGHHTHSVANVKRALRFGVPTLILYRHPEDAVSSKCARFGADPREASLRYAHFYAYILEVSDEVMLISFEEATEKANYMINKFENFSKIKFPVKDISKLEKEVMSHIETWSDRNKKRKKISTPSDKRDKIKIGIKSRIKDYEEYKIAKEKYEIMECTKKR